MKQVCTSIEQSQKLLELGLSPNTADMYYQRVMPKSVKIEVGNPVEALSWYKFVMFEYNILEYNF